MSETVIDNQPSTASQQNTTSQQEGGGLSNNTLGDNTAPSGQSEEPNKGQQQGALDKSSQKASEAQEEAPIVSSDILAQELSKFGEFSQESYDALVSEYGQEAVDEFEKELITQFKQSDFKQSDDTNDGGSDDVESLSEEQIATISAIAEPFGGIEAMGDKANLLIIRGLATEEQLSHIGKMMVGSGAVAQEALNEFTRLVDSLEGTTGTQNSTFSSDNTIMNNKGSDMLISQLDYGKQVREAVKRGDSATVSELNKRVEYTMKHNPNHWTQ